MYICMTWQKFILKKKPRKFMHIHIFDISPLDYFWTDCLIRVFFFVRNVCQKECFCFYPRTAGSLVNGVGHTKGEPSVEDLWKVFPHSPGDGVLRRHWEKDPMFTLKKKTARVCYSTCWRLIQTSHQKLRFTFKNWIFVKRSDALVWSEAQLKRFRESIYS